VTTGTTTGTTTNIGEGYLPCGYCEAPPGCIRLTWQLCHEGKALTISVYSGAVRDSKLTLGGGAGVMCQSGKAGGVPLARARLFGIEISLSIVHCR
jgi:hypothetical protein